MANMDRLCRVAVMLRFGAIVLGMLIISACSSTGQQSPQPGGDSETTSESVSDSKSGPRRLPPDEGEVICRYEKTIGSRIGTRVCRTEAAERAAREAGQEALERNAMRTDDDRIVTE